MNDSIEELIDGVRQDIRKLEKENKTLKRGFAEYMGLRELAVYSDLSISILKGYIHEGILPCFKVKGKVLVKKSEFDSWIEGYRVNQKQRIEDIADEVIRELESASISMIVGNHSRVALYFRLIIAQSCGWIVGDIWQSMPRVRAVK